MQLLLGMHMKKHKINAVRTANTLGFSTKLAAGKQIYQNYAMFADMHMFANVKFLPIINTDILNSSILRGDDTWVITIQTIFEIHF